jgi:hypothetical protein
VERSGSKEEGRKFTMVIHDGILKRKTEKVIGVKISKQVREKKKYNHYLI